MKKLSLLHLQAFMNSLGQLSRSLGATTLTVMVIGMALALPLGLSLFLTNIESVTQDLQNTQQISLYLKQDVGNAQAQNLQHSIQMDQNVKLATYISPEEGLKEFSASSGFGDVLQDLKENPLPGVIIVTPSDLTTAEEITQLVDRLQHLPAVETVQLDMKWLSRLQAILDVGHRAATLLMFLFGLAVIFIIGNTIRLTTAAHHQEILVIKLIGGTNHFIRRPFLYSGMIYGFLGALVAWMLVDFSIWCLQTPLSHLISLYGAVYQIQGLSLIDIFSLIVAAIFLGLLASWMAVNRYISKVEPQ